MRVRSCGHERGLEEMGVLLFSVGNLAPWRRSSRKGRRRYQRNRLHSNDRIACVGLQLTIQKVPGDHAVFGGGLEEVRGKYTQRLPGADQVPSWLDNCVSRLTTPLAFDRYGAVAFKELPHGETLDCEGMGRDLPLLSKRIHGYSLRSQEIYDVPET